MSRPLFKNIIFIGGIHGVGKTTLSKKISEELSFKHYSASELIARLRSENMAIDKRVNNVAENQNLLLEAIKKYLNAEEYYLLDGHFCLLNSFGKITRIGTDTFRDLGLNSIMVLVDEEAEILKRLTARDNIQYDLTLLKEFQKEEISYAKEIAKDIGVKCKIINTKSNANEILTFINNAISV